MPNFIVQKNENFTENTDAEHYIEITDGPHAGVCFLLGQITFLGEDDEGNGRVSFDYNLLFTPEHVNLEEEKGNIEESIGGVLHKILEDMTKNEEMNEARNINSDESIEG